MRNSANYLRLWQQKRSELQVNSDPRLGWLEMQALLDVSMPVGHSAPGKFMHIAKFKWLYLAIVTTITATIIYFALHHPGKEIKSRKYDHKIEFRKDSLSDRSANESLIENGTPNHTSVNAKAMTSSPANHPSGNNPASVSVTGKVEIVNGGNSVEAGNMPVNNSRSAAKNSPATSSNNAIQPAVNNKTGRLANASVHNLSIRKRGISISNFKRADNSRHNNRSVSYYGSDQAGKVINRVRYGSYHAVINSSTLSDNKINTALSAFNNGDHRQDKPLSTSSPGKLNFSFNINTLPLIAMRGINPKVTAKLVPGKAQTTDKDKNTKTKNTAISNFDWGILGGLNLPGSLTPKAQNSNFYGSLPADAFFGLFAAYNAGSKWAVNMQVRLLNPHLLSGSYTHANNSKIDTNQTLQISDSRKIYTVDVPVHLVYRITNNISIKAGPVISVPLKQANGNSSFQTSKARKDTIGYYATVTNALNNTTFEKKVKFGLSAGIGLDIKRLSIDATYYRAMQAQKVSSVLGNYTVNMNAVQLTIGFKLNKGKR